MPRDTTVPVNERLLVGQCSQHRTGTALARPTCPDGAGFPRDPPSVLFIASRSASVTRETRGKVAQRRRPANECTQEKRQVQPHSHASCPQLFPLTDWESQTGKASWPAQPAPNELPGFAMQSPPGSTPRSEDALPALLGAGAGAVLDRLGPPRCPGPGRTRTRDGEATPPAQPHFQVHCPSGILDPLMLEPGRQQLETGHGSHPATAGPGGDPAAVTPSVGLPSESSRGLGAGGPVSAGSPGAPVTASTPAR